VDPEAIERYIADTLRICHSGMQTNNAVQNPGKPGCEKLLSPNSVFYSSIHMIVKNESNPLL